MSPRSADELLATVKSIEDQIARHEAARTGLPDDAFAERLAHREQIEKLTLELRTARTEAKELLEAGS